MYIQTLINHTEGVYSRCQDRMESDLHAELSGMCAWVERKVRETHTLRSHHCRCSLCQGLNAIDHKRKQPLESSYLQQRIMAVRQLLAWYRPQQRHGRTATKLSMSERAPPCRARTLCTPSPISQLLVEACNFAPWALQAAAL